MAKTILKGTYCLLIKLEKDAQIKVGKLGKVNFKKGGYVYVGSALNSMEPRIKRHLSSDKKLHWHVDYLLAHKDSKITDVIYAVKDAKMECEVAEIIAENGAGVEDFGCSDCKCPSHLFYFENLDNLNKYCMESYEKLGLTPQTYQKTN